MSFLHQDPSDKMPGGVLSLDFLSARQNNNRNKDAKHVREATFDETGFGGSTAKAIKRKYVRVRENERD